MSKSGRTARPRVTTQMLLSKYQRQQEKEYRRQQEEEYLRRCDEKRYEREQSELHW